jgi:hypothetical protein
VIYPSIRKVTAPITLLYLNYLELWSSFTLLLHHTKKPLGGAHMRYLQEAKSYISLRVFLGKKFLILYFTAPFKAFPATNRGTLRAAI